MFKRRRRPQPTYACPNCGDPVRVGALACPSCGSDAETGWSEDAEDMWYEDLEGYGEPEAPSGARGLSPTVMLVLLVVAIVVLVLA